jgi:hypothetical protein
LSTADVWPFAGAATSRREGSARAASTELRALLLDAARGLDRLLGQLEQSEDFRVRQPFDAEGVAVGKCFGGTSVGMRRG